MFALNLENGFTSALQSPSVLRSWAHSAIKTSPHNTSCLDPILHILQHRSIRYECAAFPSDSPARKPVGIFLRLQETDYCSYCTLTSLRGRTIPTLIEKSMVYLGFDADHGNITWYPVNFIDSEISLLPTSVECTPLPEILAPTLCLSPTFHIPLLLTTQWGLPASYTPLTSHDLGSITALPAYLRHIPPAATLTFECNFCTHEPSELFNADNPVPDSNAPYILSSSFSLTFPETTPFQLRYSTFIDNTTTPNASLSQVFLQQLSHFLYSTWQFRMVLTSLQQQGLPPLQYIHRKPSYGPSTIWRMADNYLWQWQANKQDLLFHHPTDSTGNHQTTFPFPTNLTTQTSEISRPFSALHQTLQQLQQLNSLC